MIGNDTITTVYTNNRNALDRARILGAGEFRGSIFPGNGKITFMNEEAAEAMSEVTGYIRMK